MVGFSASCSRPCCPAGFVRADEPIRIGAIFSVTGPASFLGEPERKYREDAGKRHQQIRRPPRRKVEIIVYDDETDATKAVTALDRLIKKDKVVAIIGPSTSGNTSRSCRRWRRRRSRWCRARRRKKIVQPTRPYVFKVVPSDILAVKKIFLHAKKAGISRIAILSASDGYGAGGREDMKELAPQMGIVIVADEVYGPKDTDMTAQLTKIKGTDAQAIVCWGTNPGPAVISRNACNSGSGRRST